jgi:hypothetical protein
MPIVHNKSIRKLLKVRYELDQIGEIWSVLERKGTFLFPSLKNGLFPAANLHADGQYTGYGYVWVRDNVYVALAHYTNGATEVALKAVRTLVKYFYRHRKRFDDIISGKVDASDPMNRPNIRFKGSTLKEIGEKWAHAQNDALGYFVWILCRIYRREAIALTQEEGELLMLFASYWNRIKYWEDEDSGHWEETRKNEASSIGVVVGALREMKSLIDRGDGGEAPQLSTAAFFGLLDGLIDRGKERLNAILPAECIQEDPGKFRRYDAALLFLIYPMDVVERGMAEKILEDVVNHLQGPYGIRRYIGDSFWAADYRAKLSPNMRTIDVSDNIGARDSLLREGEEAQWCIFDPIISIIYGLWYQKTGREADLELQTAYFNRCLGQLTEESNRFGAFKCPELYFLEDGRYTANDTVPLLWTQANLWMAFKYMRDSLQVGEDLPTKKTVRAS